MKYLIKAVSALFILALFNGAYAHNKVVVIPMGGDPAGGYCPAAEGSNTIGGPAALHNFCWYLSAPRTTCDTVCSDVGGTNLAYQAENAWSDDSCYSGANQLASDADVTTWFFNNGNPGNWSGQYPSGTSFHTLGYGSSTGYFGKCSTGAVTTIGNYPGEIYSSGFSFNIVCPCFGFVAP